MKTLLSHLSYYISEVGIMVAILTFVRIILPGNDGSRANDTVPFPAKHPEVISVGGHDEYGKHANLSSEGDHIDFLCLSQNVKSTGIHHVHLSLFLHFLKIVNLSLRLLLDDPCKV